MDAAPLNRSDFEVAIICALPLEYNAVAMVIDHFWDDNGDRYGRAVGDENKYTTGRIGKTDVVLVLLSNMGKASAAGTMAGLRSSFGGIRLALLTGICGAAPGNGDEDVLLGDVVISKTVVQHDFGRQYADGFAIKDTVEDVPGRPSKNIRNLIAYLETSRGRTQLEKRAGTHLQAMQEKPKGRRGGPNYAYPGVNHDQLFEADYQHKHQTSTTCVCAQHRGHTDPVCEESRSMLCGDVGCDITHLVQRDRVKELQQESYGTEHEAQPPWIFVGRIGSGDMVVKSAAHRDRLAAQHKIMGFEMEGVGVWDEVPCIVVKGVCDYADSHKNKRWQNFAAATAASTVKALLEQYTKTDRPAPTVPRDTTLSVRERQQVGQPCRYIPFQENRRFVGRTSAIAVLKEKLFGDDDDASLRVVIVGLGGVGKTQVALQMAFWTMKNKPEWHVFWLPALSLATFDQACGEIARLLGLERAESADAKDLVRRFLESDASNRWLIIIDNADDEDVMEGGAHGPRGHSICDFLPRSDRGRILFTTRNQRIATRLAQSEVVDLSEMNAEEARDLMEKSLINKRLLADDKGVADLLKALTNLPLAIAQAAAYLNEMKVSVAEYLRLLRNTERDMVELLETEFSDDTRYNGTHNAVANTKNNSPSE
ncbi:hypothetical protein ACHAQH_009469 [Verticillium albo-atrum]